MTGVDLTAEQIIQITDYVDVEAPPPDGQPSALLIFGTNQLAPTEIAAERHKLGLAPLIIATGGVNRHNGVVEAREFQKSLIEQGVDDQVIRVEDRSAKHLAERRTGPALPARGNRRRAAGHGDLQVVPPPGRSHPQDPRPRHRHLPRHHLGTCLRTPGRHEVQLAGYSNWETTRCPRMGRSHQTRRRRQFHQGSYH